ncbi:MAG: hypothetical protein ATN36_05695 [Epulopiscium sp. Nele67-Bin005]|nr:MAG: hypothetical protein ATN36_05695 [Epulopiscium sp. Nele67-Bin005]
MQNVEVTVKLKIKDVMRYNLWVAYRSKFSKLTFLMGCALLGYVAYQWTINTSSLGVFLSHNILWIILTALALCGTPMKVWQITLMQMQMPIFSAPSKYNFFTDKISLEVGEMSDIVSWQTYSIIKETNKDFRFFVDAVQAQIIPKDCMENEQIELLRTIIKQAVPQENYNLKG